MTRFVCKLALLALAACALPALLAADPVKVQPTAPLGERSITGFLSPGQDIRLGDDISNFDLSSFNLESSPSAGVDAYVAGKAILSIDSQNIMGSLWLFFSDGQLTGTAFNVSTQQESYAELRHYWRQRYGGFKELSKSTDDISWQDREGNVTAVVKSLRGDGSPCTVLLFEDQDFYAGLQDQSLPDWIQSVLEKRTKEREPSPVSDN